MKAGTRTAVYDRDLHVEAYIFDGVVQAFPNHIHEYYVIGLVERGERRLLCINREYSVGSGDVLVFNPGDSHSCTQSGGALLYRALNIPRDVMLAHLERSPHFAPNVLREPGIATAVRTLHEAIYGAVPGREALLAGLLETLSSRYGERTGGTPHRDEVERAREYIERNFAGHVTLDAICRAAGLSKSALLRAFTKSLGVTPHCYLESVRVGAARRILEQGAAPVEAANLCGFADQSHMTNCFGRLIGLSPGAYREIFSKDGD